MESINNLIRQFDDKRIDLLIVFQADLEEIKTEYVSTIIKRMPYGVICRKDHPLFLKKEITIHDIESETICCFDHSYMKYMEKDIYRQFAEFNIEPSQIRRYSDWTNMEVSLLSGVGITLTYEAFFVLEENGNIGYNTSAMYRYVKIEEKGRVSDGIY